MSTDPAAPLFAIVTIVRNDREGLARTLESVAAQTFRDLEHVVVDGGSTDGSVDVLRAHAGGIARWVSEPDGGIADAFNKGLALSRGTWVNFLNAGDTFLDPTSLGQVVPYLARAPIVSAQSSTAGWLSPPVAPRNDHPLPRRAWLSHQASFVHRSVFARCGGFDTRFRICMDYEFWLRSLAVFELAFIERPVVEFAPGGISSRDQATWQAELAIANRLHLPRAGLVNLRIRLRYHLHRLLESLGIFEVYRRMRFGQPARRGPIDHRTC